jgi:hypothetical protein
LHAGTRPRATTAGCERLAERRAERAVAVSFFLLAPYIAVEAMRSLIGGEHPDTSVLGIAVTASSVVLMPALGIAKRRLGQQLGSNATAGEGTQNLLCAAQGAAVLLGLAANAAFGAWWLDAVIALGLAAIAVNEGREALRGEGCCVGGALPRATIGTAPTTAARPRRTGTGGQPGRRPDRGLQVADVRLGVRTDGEIVK